MGGLNPPSLILTFFVDTMVRILKVKGLILSVESVTRYSELGVDSKSEDCLTQPNRSYPRSELPPVKQEKQEEPFELELIQ